MRVLHVSKNTRHGGAELHAAAVATAQCERGDSVAWLHEDADAQLPDDVTSLRANGRGAIELAIGFAPDVVHVHGTSLEAVDEVALHERFPTVFSLHDVSFGCSTSEHWFRGGAACTRAHGPGCVANSVVRGCAHRTDPRPMLRRYAAVSRRLPLLRSAGAAVVYSEYVRSVAVQNGLPAANCHVIPYFVERDAGMPSPVTSRRIAFVGRLVPAKGLDVLLAALQRCTTAWDSLVVVGDGWERRRLEALATKLGLRARVDFLGWRPRVEVTEVLRESRLLALPSRWPEPFGIVGIEAMAAGRAVVAAGTGGIPEWLDDGETGMLVPPGDAAALSGAITSLLDDDALAQRLGEEGWRRVARFSEQAHLASLDRVYEGVR